MPGDIAHLADWTDLGVALAAIVAMVIIGVAQRRIVRAGSPTPGWEPTVEALAYLAGGPQQAVLSALAGLRVTDSVHAYAGGPLVASGPPRREPGPLTWAADSDSGGGCGSDGGGGGD